MVVGEVDEELRVRRVRVHRARRAERAAVMRDAREFGGQVRILRATRTGAAGVVILFHVGVLDIAGLRHEALDDAVEGDVVIGAVAGKLLHPLGVLGRDLGHQLDHDIAILERQDDGVFGVFDLGHRWSSSNVWRDLTQEPRPRKEQSARGR
ncbi:hypothetical protein SDC9_40518 [bioreactor metagenome]|uniref:Uncharacterized protein n=1 Tax=bioreactor metagenome TaxID=1076179 RepID=A0A644VSH9_9ZZZZ